MRKINQGVSSSHVLKVTSDEVRQGETVRLVKKTIPWNKPKEKCKLQDLGPRKSARLENLHTHTHTH